MSGTSPLATGASLRFLRRIAGLTLEETAVVADTSVAYLRKVETGRLDPSVTYVTRVASALGDCLRAAR